MENIQKRQTSMFIPYYIKDSKIYVFLQKRSSAATRNPNSIGAFGGGLENNESYEDALMREMKEELEYKPENYQYLGIFETEYSISNYYIEKVDENFKNKLIIHEGDSGDWYEVSEVINKENVSDGTKYVINSIITKLIK